MQHTPPHPNVVGFLGGSLKKPFVLALTLMQGSLEKLLLEDQEYPLDFIGANNSDAIAKATLEHLKTVIWFLVGASAGLLQLHSHGVVHCDVAARNMLVDHNDNCCVCDFGMSQILPEDQTFAETSKEDKIPIAWVAPETLEKRIWSAKTDVYSFGVMIYELMTRKHPYSGMKIEDVTKGVRNAHEPLRPHIDGWWPSDVAELATDCMAHQPHDRPTILMVNQRLHRYYKRLTSAQLLSAVYLPVAPLVGSDYAAVAAVRDTSYSTYKRVPASLYYLNC